MFSETYRREYPLILALLLVGTILGGLLVGYEPVGGDPDRLYRPLKTRAGPGCMTAASLSGVSDSGWALRWLPRAMSRPFIHRISFFTSFSTFQRLTAFPCGFIISHLLQPLMVMPALSESVLGGAR